MSLVDDEVRRLKELASDVLESMYGSFSVWNIQINEIKKEEDRIRINGIYYGDALQTRRYNFNMELDNKYRLINFKRS